MQAFSLLSSPSVLLLHLASSSAPNVASHWKPPVTCWHRASVARYAPLLHLAAVCPVVNVSPPLTPMVFPASDVRTEKEPLDDAWP